MANALATVLYILLTYLLVANILGTLGSDEPPPNASCHCIKLSTD